MSIHQLVRGDQQFDDLKRFLLFSALVHVFFFVGGSLLDVFGSDRGMEFDTVKAKLVKLGKERKKHLLPRIVKKKRPVVKKNVKKKGNSLKKKKVPKKKPHRVKQKPKKKPSLDELLSGAMNDIEKDARAEVSDEGSKSGVKDGDVTDPTLQVKGNLYIRKISRLIRKNWKLPGIIPRDDLPELQTEIFFRITYSGDMYNISISQKSGNNIFDSSVIRAIKKTGTIPLPDDKKLRKLVLREGLEWTFKPGH